MVRQVSCESFLQKYYTCLDVFVENISISKVKILGNKMRED